MDLVALGTKAETLERLAPRLTTARVLPLLWFTVDQWRRDRGAQIARVEAAAWLAGAVIVRSSARAEDGTARSLAGHFLSVGGVRGREAFESAVDAVVQSCGGGEDQVLVQPFVEDVALAGVAFSVDPNTGGPYLVVNYDDTGRSTSSVTRGATNQVKTCYVHRSAEAPKGPLSRVAQLAREVEALTGVAQLDLEFAMTSAGELLLLQARRLNGVEAGPVSADEHRAALAFAEEKLRQQLGVHPYLHGPRSVLGVMPDWNPAEMIGIRPRPLALSLYRELITDSIWAYQRDNYGYKNLRSFPLLVSLAGLPYIDARVSFNSFIPADVPADLSDRLASYYIDRLVAVPANHDKVEFEIIFTCYTLDLPDRIQALRGAGFSEGDVGALTGSLRALTNRIIHGETGLWRKDIAKIETLEGRQKIILESPLDLVSKIYWLLEDCKRYGTLPFAGLARAGFIAVQMLRSLVAVGVLDHGAYDAFAGSLETVGSRMAHDFRSLGREAFLVRYGHLRPGTYDILAPRYDETPDRYFDWTAAPAPPPARPVFSLSLEQMRRIQNLLTKHQLDHDVLGLFDFIKSAIEGRELGKFVFTRSLSEALRLLGQLGRERGLSLEQCSYLDIGCIRELNASSASAREILERSVADGERRYALTRRIVLPPLITQPEEVWAFHMPTSQPNYITQRKASGTIAFARDAQLAGKVLLIPSADPGYDWIFSRGIAAFITQYGGLNSHMAIRAGELGIPAVIGAGEALFERWSAAQVIEIDCANRQVRVVR